MIAIVDYGMGNLRSVQKAFETSGARAIVTSSRVQIKKAKKIVLPGVGAFSAAAEELEKRGLAELLKSRIEAGVPYLGLCLGLQLLFTESEESSGKKVRGFDLIPGKIKRFQGDKKVPHMGWNTLDIKKEGCPLLRGMKGDEYVYFVHSFYAAADKDFSAATTNYGGNFCSVLWKGNIFATQFHPEKSQKIGLRIIKNFTEFKS